MHTWQLLKAQAQLTELIDAAQHTPQMIGEEVVVISLKKYYELTGQSENIVTFFKNSPLYGIELDLTRDSAINGRGTTEL